MTLLPLMAAMHTLSFAQTVQRQTSWQQKVSHDIQVKFDPNKKMLYANQEVSYFNGSPDTLNEIWFHIWPEAFRDNNTFYGNEAEILGNTKYLNARKEQIGRIDSLSFVINGKSAKFTKHKKHPDIIKLELPEPLLPGASMKISNVFFVKIPFLFSRMGYNGSFYSITQWYPKPAVYDVNGWNYFPYAEQGEYFSEFGHYKVSITLPANMVVAATGVLKTEDEKNWMASLENGKNTRDSNETKTIVFEQDNVPDFAWFADAKFTVNTDTIYLPDNTPVIARGVYRKSKNSVVPMEAIERAIKFYSERVGKYPYPECTVVVGPLSAAGGMEYPMVTICGSNDETTIIHEVGHNWFQCVLGSNERRHPWMDESINTYYEGMLSKDKFKKYGFGDAISVNAAYFGFRASVDLGLEQSGTLHSHNYQSLNYGTIVYGVNPQRFAYLEEVLGIAMFDACMQEYFKRWQFKHPLPGDIQDVFQEVSGQNLDWFFKGLMAKNAPDLKIVSADETKSGTKIKVENKSSFALPVMVSAYNGKENNFVFSGNDTTVVLPGKYSRISVNPTGLLPENRLDNNDFFPGKLFKRGTPKIGFPGLYKRGEKKIWAFPLVFTFNNYDGYMPGIMLSNLSFPRRSTEWWVAPMYGLRSGNITGIAGIRKNYVHARGRFSRTELMLGAHRFGFAPDSIVNAYTHFRPKMTMFYKRKKSYIQDMLEFSFDVNRTDKVQQQFSLFDSTGTEQFYQKRISSDLNNTVFRAAFTRFVFKKASPATFTAGFEIGGNNKAEFGRQDPFRFMRYDVTFDKYVHYPNRWNKKAGLRARLYGVGFLWQNNNANSGGAYNPVISGANGTYDYAFREIMFGRSENVNSAKYSNQLLSQATGVRMLNTVTTDRWLLGANMQSHIFPGVPLLVYTDLVLARSSTDKMELYRVSGISISGYTGNYCNYEVNLPLSWSSFKFGQFANRYKWYELASFRVSWNIWNPLKLARLAVN